MFETFAWFKENTAQFVINAKVQLKLCRQSKA